MTQNSVLLLSALLFAVGLGGALTRRNAIMLLVSIEIMMNAANLNFVAFWRFGDLPIGAHLFALFVIIIAGAESTVGLALIIAIYRQLKSVDVDKVDSLSG